MDDRLRDETLGVPGTFEFGDETGARRENDPRAPGYTPEDDRLFRSHFQRANSLADRAYEHVVPVYAYGHSAAREAQWQGRTFDEVEPELAERWSSAGGRSDWATVRDFARVGFERGRAVGFVDVATETVIGTSPSHDRASFADPVADDMDPTSPDSPEQTMPWTRAAGDEGADRGADIPRAE